MGQRLAFMPLDPHEFVARHGVVLASARGPVPSIAEAIAGGPIRGSWWGHEKGHEIFAALSALEDDPEVLSFRLVGGKITLVHRRLWPALVRLSAILGTKRLAVTRQEHTATGAHKNVTVPFPEWVSPEVRRIAEGMDERDARAQLGAWVASS